MTGAKSTFDKVDDDLVTKMVEVASFLEMASEYVEPLKRRVLSGSDEKAKTYLSAYESSFQAAKNLVAQVNANIESTKERLELKKISYEAREIAARSWPKKTWIEKMTWVATAMFPSGGVGFVFAGGLTDESLLFAIVVWSVAIFTLVASLWALKNEDKRKWEFFSREFEIESQGSSKSVPSEKRP